MRAGVFGSDLFLVNADGTPVVIQESDGSLKPYEVFARLDGEPCSCVYADEEAGVALVCDPWIPGAPQSYSVRTGKVELEVCTL